MQINFNELGLDDIDVKIFEMLSSDGRKNFTEIGKKLGISHTAVQKRVKKLCENKKMKFTARFDLYGDSDLFEVTVYSFAARTKNAIVNALSRFNFVSQVFVYEEEGTKYLRAFCYGNDVNEIESKLRDIMNNSSLEYEFKIKKIMEKAKQIY